MTNEFSSREFLLQEVLANKERMLAVHQTGFAKAQHNKRFDHLAEIARSVFNAPVSQVTLFGEQTRWFKSNILYDLVEIPTQTSFCTHTITASALPLVVCDTNTDPNFKDNPFVINPPYIRFYAGYPIWFDNEKVGTVCVYDFEPREKITDEQITVIKQISDQATTLLKLLAQQAS